MSKNIAVPEHLYNKAAELAARDQVTVEEFVSALLTRHFERALQAIPDVEPEPHDRQ